MLSMNFKVHLVTENDTNLKLKNQFYSYEQMKFGNYLNSQKVNSTNLT